MLFKNSLQVLASFIIHLESFLITWTVSFNG